MKLVPCYYLPSKCVKKIIESVLQLFGYFMTYKCEAWRLRAEEDLHLVCRAGVTIQNSGKISNSGWSAPAGFDQQATQSVYAHVAGRKRKGGEPAR